MGDAIENGVESVASDIEYGAEALWDDAVSLVENVFSDALTAAESIVSMMQTVVEVADFVENLVHNDGNGQLTDDPYVLPSSMFFVCVCLGSRKDGYIDPL